MAIDRSGPVMWRGGLACFDQAVSPFDLATGSLRAKGRIGAILAARGVVFKQLPDPFRLGQHRGPDEVSLGILYTARGGFIDISHLRDSADVAKSIFDAIAARNGAPGEIRSMHGVVRIPRQLPNDRRLWADIAAVAANDDGFMYEQYTYGVRLNGKPLGCGMQNSAFSPEDLTSNYIGIHLARESILSGKDYNAEMTRRLDAAMRELEAQSPARAEQAIARAVELGWLKSSGGVGIYLADFIRRRNFERRPFQVGSAEEHSPPAWITAPLPDVGQWYSYCHTMGARLEGADRERYDRAIRADALERYGDRYDRP